jgi:integrase
MKQIFDMAVAEGHIERNPALLLFTPKEAAKPVRRVMNIKEVQMCFAALDPRERLIAKLAVIAGMRPGEIFALTWGRLTATYADIRQRVYRGTIDTPRRTSRFVRPPCPRVCFGKSRSGGNSRLKLAMTPGCFRPKE